MISLEIEFNCAKLNIKYLNRIKSRLSQYFPHLDNMELINFVEPLINKRMSNSEINTYLNLNLDELSLSSIFTPQSDEVYPSKNQAESFTDNLDKIYYLDDKEKDVVKKKFIHVWQIPRTTKTPKWESLINLIQLFNEEETVLINKLLEKKAA